MFRNVLLILACGYSVSEIAAQYYGTLHVNDVEFTVSAEGHIGADTYGGSPAFFVPAGNGTLIIYSAGLWLAGLTDDGQLKVAADFFRAEGSDFFPGPLTISGDASISPEVSAAYDHVWSVNALAVERHRAYFACLNDPECDLSMAFPDGYDIPSDFITWPAVGDTDSDQAAYLAPFFDYNMDGAYSASDGDHPCVSGDHALFSIFNDKLAPHTESNGEPLGVEVHMTSFAYSAVDPALEQTVFVHYTVFNRSDQTLNDLRVGHFLDPDLGCAFDDFVGTDVSRSMSYVYNQDEHDGDCHGMAGFGSQPPAFGMVVLNGPKVDPDGLDNLTSHSLPAISGSGFGDLVIDNERHGLSNTMTWLREGSFAVTDPTGPSHFFSYLGSYWKDGVHQSYGGMGYSTEPGAVSSLFVYPGDSDPFGSGTNGVSLQDWAESVEGPFDRRGVSTLGSITLEPGAQNDFLIAYVFARATTGGALASITALQQRVDSIATFARTIPGLVATGSACDALTTVGVLDHSMENLGLSLFPVPTNQELNVSTRQFSADDRIEIFDAQGKQVSSSRTTGAVTAIDVQLLAPGLYTARIAGSRFAASGRFVKE